MLQCDAVRCRVLQCATVCVVCCSVLQLHQKIYQGFRAKGTGERGSGGCFVLQRVTSVLQYDCCIRNIEYVITQAFTKRQKDFPEEWENLKDEICAIAAGTGVTRIEGDQVRHLRIYVYKCIYQYAYKCKRSATMLRAQLSRE